MSPYRDNHAYSAVVLMGLSKAFDTINGLYVNVLTYMVTGKWGGGVVLRPKLQGV